MLKLSWKGVLANKARLGLTAIAIVIGVSFVAGAYVFTDSLKAAFDVLFETEGQQNDLIVRAETEFELSSDIGTIPEELLDRVVAVDGVERAVPLIQSTAQLVDKNGDPIGGFGPPTLGFSWVEGTEEVSALNMRSGRGPVEPDEVVIDAYTAEDNGFVVGDEIDVILITGVETFEISGIVSFGDADNLLGATIAAFEMETAQRVFDLDGRFSQISIMAEPGVDIPALQAEIAGSLPDGVEVITGDVEIQEGQDQVDEGVGQFNTVLLAFALVAVFVGGFIIQNTYRIIVSARTRELGMLRAVGATGRQVTRMVLLEALIVGLIGSAVGVLAGIGLALGLKSLFGVLGFGFPEGPLTIAGRTVVVAMTVGVVITVASAILPARKASKVAPVAVLREIESTYFRSLRRRMFIGLGILAAGIGLLVLGLYGNVDNELAATGAGAAVTFIGVAVLAPLVARRFVKVFGHRPAFLASEVVYLVLVPLLAGVVLASPLFVAALVTGEGALSVAGLLVALPAAGYVFWRFLQEDAAEWHSFRLVSRLARDNSARKPRRTAATASALMVGVALVAVIATLGESLKGSIADAVGEEVIADYQIEYAGFADPTTTGVSPQLADDLSALAEVGEVTRVRLGLYRDPETLKESFLWGVDEYLDEAVRLELRGGDYGDLAPGTAVVHEDFAESRELEIGDTFPVEYPDGAVATLEVVAVSGADLFQQGGGGEVMIDLRDFAAHQPQKLDVMLMLNVAPGLDAVAARPAIEAVVAGYPNVEMSNAEEYVDKVSGQIDFALNIVTALLAMAILIALVGIMNTMALSIRERRREIGLLRAVGETRSQVRRMVRWEAVLISVFGAVIGLVVGGLLGAAVVLAIGEGITLSLPWLNLLVYLVAAAVGGILFALWPAWRGAKMDVLEAIAYE